MKRGRATTEKKDRRLPWILCYFAPVKDLAFGEGKVKLKWWETSPNRSNRERKEARDFLFVVLSFSPPERRILRRAIELLCIACSLVCVVFLQEVFDHSLHELAIAQVSPWEPNALSPRSLEASVLHAHVHTSITPYTQTSIHERERHTHTHIPQISKERKKEKKRLCIYQRCL